MRYFYSLICFFLLSTTYAQVYQPATYHYNGTPTNGVKIKTNLPFVVGNSMPTIIIEGYNYNTAEPIGLMINYYIYSPGGVTGDPLTYYFIKYGATSYGAYTPPIKLANENNKVVIYIDSKEYFQRFMVRAFAKGLSEQTTWFDGWTVVDEALTGTSQVTLPYRNRFKNEVYLDGGLSIGTAVPSQNITISRPVTLSGSVSVNNFSPIKKGVSSMVYYNSNAQTDADTFTVSSLAHYSVNQGTFGANSTVSNQYGFIVNNNMSGATNNYAFYGNVGANTNRWNLYMNGSANNYLAGNLGIGSTTLAGNSFRVSKAITGATTSIGIRSDGQVQPDVTGAAYNFRSDAQVAVGFTNPLPALMHYSSIQGTLGSTVSTQVGFNADASLSGATNNYGFRGLLNSGTGKWNLYMVGTANNYLGGRLGIGTTTLDFSNLSISLPLTGGSNFYSAYNHGIIQSDVTGIAAYYRTNASTQASSFTVGSVVHYGAYQGSFSTPSAVTNQYGVYVDGSLTGAVNNYGVFSNIAVATNRWNLYMAGTAGNYLEGSVGIGTTAVPTGYKMAVLGKVIAEEIKVRKQSNGWPDYVFSSTYKLPSLNEVEKFIKKNSHLPEIPSAKEIEENGLVLGEMNAKLLQKIEELTLYIIEQNKKIISLEEKNKQIESLKKEIKEIKDFLKK